MEIFVIFFFFLIFRNFIGIFWGSGILGHIFAQRLYPSVFSQFNSVNFWQNLLVHRITLHSDIFLLHHEQTKIVQKILKTTESPVIEKIKFPKILTQVFCLDASVTVSLPLCCRLGVVSVYKLDRFRIDGELCSPWTLCGQQLTVRRLEFLPVMVRFPDLFGRLINFSSSILENRIWNSFLTQQSSLQSR